MTINITQIKSKTAISIDHQLLQETDSVAQELSVSRSELVSSALDEYIRRYRNKQLLSQINAAVVDEMTEDEQQTMSFIRDRRKKLGDNSVWK